MNDICEDCKRPVWNGGHGISNKYCTDVMDGGFSCKLLHLINQYGSKELVELSKLACKIYK